MESSKKPDWVPETAWADFVGYVERLSGPLPFGIIDDEFTASQTYALDAIRRVINDVDCASIWSAIYRRASIGEHHHNRMKKYVTTASPEHDPGFRPFCDLFEKITGALSGPPRLGLIPASERKKRGGRMEELVRNLTDELRSVRQECGGVHLPPEFEAEFLKLAERVSSENLNDRFIGTGSSSEGERWAAFNGVLAVTHAGEFAPMAADWGKEFFPALAALGRAAHSWSETKPVLYRPNDERASQLFFIRHMTRAFDVTYKTPLREATAALTRCVFDCEMSVSTVAKLAPLNKTREK